MPHELFETVTAPSVGVSARSPCTVAVSIVAHVLLIAAVVITPLVAVDALPKPRDVTDIIPIVDAPPPPPEATPPVVRAEAAPSASPPVVPPVDSFPTEAPNGVRDEVLRPPSAPTIGVDDRGLGVPNAMFTGQSYTATVPVPPPSGPVRPGGQIREPQKIFNVAPVYPAIARSARIEGLVVIEAIIGVDGTVREARLRTSVPLLDQAALDAVRQWRYRPTTLNGVPVAVIMTVSVRFGLTP